MSSKKGGILTSGNPPPPPLFPLLAMAAAPQAGAEVELYMNAAHVFTDGAVFEVDGDANYTAAIGDRVLLRAKSTTVITVHPRKKDGTAVVATTPAAPGWTLISTTTASASATVDITGLTSIYEAFVIVVTDLIPQTDTTSLQLRTSTDGGSTYDAGASNYRWVAFPGHEAGSNRTGSAGDTEIEICGSDAGYHVGNDVGESLNAEIWISNPLGTAVYKKIRWHADYLQPSGQMTTCMGSGCRVATADVDAIRFLMSSGNITSGKFRLYGVKAS